MHDRDWEDRTADNAYKTLYCVCGDHDDDHVEGVFINRRPDEAPGRACVVPFCRCSNFRALNEWRPW